MPIIGIDLEATRDFIPKQKGPKEEKTKFVLCTLDSRIHGMLRDEMTSFKITDQSAVTGEAVSSIPYNAVAFKVCQHGIKSWENFLDSKGSAIKYITTKLRLSGREYDVVDPEVLKRVPTDLIREMYREIVGNNFLSGEDAGN